MSCSASLCLCIRWGSQLILDGKITGGDMLTVRSEIWCQHSNIVCKSLLWVYWLYSLLTLLFSSAHVLGVLIASFCRVCSIIGIRGFFQDLPVEVSRLHHVYVWRFRCSVGGDSSAAVLILTYLPCPADFLCCSHRRLRLWSCSDELRRTDDGQRGRCGHLSHHR